MYKIHACRVGAVKSKGNKAEIRTHKKTNLTHEEDGEKRQEECPTFVPCT